MRNEALEGLIGCRIQTHYGTGGVVTSYSGPHKMYGPGSWSIQYRDDRDKFPHCCINSIKIENGVITCEGVPLKILGREEDTQISLF